MQFNDSNNSGDRPVDPTRAGADLRHTAVLDALGLLDEFETAQFERAFRAASPALQAELREIQSAAVADPAFLSGEEPAADLKVRTLAAVMTAVDMQETAFAPIAHIGRMAARGGRTPVRSIDASDLVEQAMALATANADRDRFARASYYWRAAAIAVIAALVVVLWFERQTAKSAIRVSEIALSKSAADELTNELQVPGLAVQIEQSDIVRGLRAVASDGTGSATLLGDTKAGTAMLLAVGLKVGETYQLRVTREDGRKETIGTFTPEQRVAYAEIRSPDLAALGAGALEIVDSRGVVVLGT